MLIDKINHIVKIGGGIIKKKFLIHCALDNFASLPTPKILIHGGGTQATYISHKMGIKQKIVHGKRITDKYTLNVVIMTYAGLINKKIVTILQKLGCNVLGMSGADVDSLKSTKKKSTPKMVYGYVGTMQYTGVNKKKIMFLVKKFIPIFCSITHNGKGLILNSNADTVASVIAISFATDNNPVILQSCFEKHGVFNYDKNYYFSLISKNITLTTSFLTKE